jgi:phage repressor protein C with HTH and peptisase S24 domain
MDEHCGPRVPWQKVRVSGYSMTPTLRDGDVVVVRHGARIRPGDLVLAYFRVGVDVPVLKRAVQRLPDGGWLLASDNARSGSDSRHYGVADVRARVAWIWQRPLTGGRTGRLAALRSVVPKRPRRWSVTNG